MREEQPLRFHVLPRYATKPEDAVAFDTDAPGFVLHVMHAHDEGDDAIVVVGSATRDFSLKFGGAPHHLYRWRLDLRTRVVSRETIDARFIEFPRVRDGLDGARARYGARMRAGRALSTGPPSTTSTSASPSRRSTSARASSAARWSSRGAPARRGGARTTATSSASCTTARELGAAILDAPRWTRSPSRATIPGRVPHGFHALWVPDDEGEEHHPRSKLF